MDRLIKAIDDAEVEIEMNTSGDPQQDWEVYATREQKIAGLIAILEDRAPGEGGYKAWYEAVRRIMREDIEQSVLNAAIDRAEDCADVAWDAGMLRADSIPWPACQINPGREP